MSKSTFKSPRFIVRVNGEQRCVAGFDGYGVLSACFSHVRRAENARDHESDVLEGAVSMRVGGLSGREHFDWLREELFVGDEVSIRVVEGGPIDPVMSSASSVAKFGTAASREAAMRLVERRRERLAQIGNVLPHRMSIAANGQLVCTAGVRSGVHTMNLTWTRRNPATKPPHKSDAADWEDGCVTLHVGGLENNIHLTWCDAEVDPGDELIIHVLGPGPVDSPAREHEHRLIPHVEQAIMLGPRISLRKLIDEDLDFVAAVLGDPEVMRYWPQVLDRAGAQDWLRRQQQRYADDGCGYWLVVDSDTHEPVGHAGVLITDLDGERLPAIGYMIHRKYQRQGYGIEAAWMCVRYIFDSRDEPVAYTLIRPENEPSLALARKLGMKLLRTVEFAGFEHILFALERLGGTDSGVQR